MPCNGRKTLQVEVAEADGTAMSLGMSTATPAAPALAGTLSDLPLFDLLNLLSRAAHSGTVYFASTPGAAITLADGEITFATADPALSLRELLLRRRVTSESAWADALNDRELDIGVALVRSGATNATEMHRVVTEQIVATLHQINGWHDVDFRFLIGSRKVIGPGLAVEIDEARELVVERTRAWEAMYDTVPSVDVTVRLVPEPPASDGVLTIDPVDWPVLVFIDGVRTIAEIAEPARRSPFEAAQAVCRLARAGLAAVTPR